MNDHDGTHHGHEHNRASMDWLCRHHLDDVNQYLAARDAPPGSRTHVDYETHYRFRRHIVMNTWKEIIRESPGDTVDNICGKLSRRLWT